MEKIGAWKLALVYAGCFLGAGYVSGQEMWQFFGVYGVGGLWGLLLAAILQAFFCAVLLSLVRIGRIREIERVPFRRDHRYLRGAVGGAQLLLLLGVSVIMSAGVGALAEQMLHRGGILASALFCAVLWRASRRGIDGMIGVFSVTVPLLTAATLVLAAITFGRFGGKLDFSVVSAPNPLMRHPVLGAVLFVSCNLFGSIAVLVPVAQTLRDGRSAYRGAILASVLLLPVALAILLSLHTVPEVTAAELPMLAMARMIHPIAGVLFALLLLVAMFGTALSCLVSAREYLMQKSDICRARQGSVMPILILLTFVGGLFGFGELIGWIYPLFGYLGFVVLCAMVMHERYLRRKR